MSFESTAEGRVGVDGADRWSKTVPHVIDISGLGDVYMRSAECLSSVEMLLVGASASVRDVLLVMLTA